MNTVHRSVHRSDNLYQLQLCTRSTRGHIGVQRAMVAPWWPDAITTHESKSKPRFTFVVYEVLYTVQYQEVVLRQLFWSTHTREKKSKNLTIKCAVFAPYSPNRHPDHRRAARYVCLKPQRGEYTRLVATGGTSRAKAYRTQYIDRG